MTPPPVSEGALARLVAILHERLGLHERPRQASGLRAALRARLAATGHDPDAYLELLGGPSGHAELRALVPLVTVGTTEFFRDPLQLAALERHVLPEALALARAEGRRLKVWSAGCATGEEVYTLAMVLLRLGARPRELDLLGTDVNVEALAIAARGAYPAKRTERLPAELRARHFRAHGGDAVVGPLLAEAARFEAHNLAESIYPAPADGGFWDLVLCRNVVIYFDRAGFERTVRGFFGVLRGGGTLCLGYAESFERNLGGFELRHVGGSVVYLRPPGPAPAVPPAPPSPAVRADPLPAAPAASRETPGTRAPWPALAARKAPAIEPPAVSPPPAPPAAAPPAPDGLAAVIARIETGAFDEALAALRRLEGADAAARLTLGNLLLVMGRHDEAVAVHRAAAAAEPLAPEPQLFLGIALAEAGRFAEADAALGRAVYLAPDEPLAQFMRGRVAERGGDPAAARRAYRNALAACRVAAARPPLRGFLPDLPADPELLARAAEHALETLGG